MNYPWPGALSYTLLKTIASSPAEFRLACSRGTTVTASMRLGTLIHWHVLGGPDDRRPEVCPKPGTRATTAYKEWAKGYAPNVELYTQAESDEAREIGEALVSAPHNVARFDKWIRGGEYEVPLEWERGGFQFSTRGVDVLHRGRALLVDLKSTRSVDPWALKRQARALHYPEQLALYRGAARANGWPVDTCAVFAGCTDDPYLTRVLTFTEDQLQAADANVGAWLTTLRTCLDTDVWPGGGETEYEDWGAPMAGEGDLESEAG